MASDPTSDNLFRQAQRQTRRLEALGRGLGREIVRLPLRTIGLIEHPASPRRVGQVPGALPELPEDQRVASRISVTHYTEDQIDEASGVTVAEAAARSQKPGVAWIDVVGVRDPQTIRALGEAFGLHPLVQEDLVNTTQRPKLETYDDQLFIVAKMIQAGTLGTPDGEAARQEARVEQVGIVLGPGYVISFQEREGDVFEPVRERLRASAGRIRSVGADYLAYALLDVIIDHYFVVIEGIGEHIEVLEEVVLNNPQPEVQAEINGLRREAIFLRRSIWPLREVLSALLRDESPLVEERTKLFLRDAYDHTIQVVDLIESFRDVLSSLVDLYLSSLSHKMNEVMKVLTVIGSIFIPLSFLTGLYGMNFAYIPELQVENGYFYFLGAIGLLLVGMLAYFKRKDWL
ncbi:MAG: magnesium/cobalt transporter CorA [Bacteroidota bacterium]